MNGWAKPLVLHPDAGSVMDYCNRLGLPYAPVGVHPDPAFMREAHDMMQALTGLAYVEAAMVKLWSERCFRHEVDNLSFKRPHSLWWGRLSRLKSSVFSPFWPAEFTSAGLIAHPWALSPDDFAKTWEALKGGQLPAGLPEHRREASTAFSWLAGFLGTAAGLATRSAATAPVAAPLGLASAGCWGAGQVLGVVDQVVLDRARDKLRARSPDLLVLYQREAVYRAKAAGQSVDMAAATVRLGR